MAITPTVHLIELRRRNNKSPHPDTGASLRVYMDGKILKGVRSIQINAKAGGVATVNLEMLAQIKANVMSPLNLNELESDPNLEQGEKNE